VSRPVVSADRARVTDTPALAGVRAILLDIEGTTTPVAFVYEVLFPFARRNLRRHLEQHASAPEYAALFDRLRDEYHADTDARAALPPWADAPADARLISVARYCEWLMERDRKSTGLKELQGRIWQEGYEARELVSVVFPDVPDALTRWRALDLDIGIFSSGSVLAQQLVFRHSSAGNLTPFIRWHFDTTTGGKTESESYRRIASAMQLPSGAILFVSDVVSELDAARDAGMRTLLSVRPGNKSSPQGHGHPIIESFEALR
jgi:enolase-phosphatase E1